MTCARPKMLQKLGHAFVSSLGRIGQQTDVRWLPCADPHLHWAVRGKLHCPFQASIGVWKSRGRGGDGCGHSKAGGRWWMEGSLGSVRAGGGALTSNYARSSPPFLCGAGHTVSIFSELGHL